MKRPPVSTRYVKARLLGSPANLSWPPLVSYSMLGLGFFSAKGVALWFAVCAASLAYLIYWIIMRAK